MQPATARSCGWHRVARRKSRLADVDRRTRLLPLRSRGHREHLFRRSDGSDLRRHTNEDTYLRGFPSTDGTRIVYTGGGDVLVLDTRDRCASTRVPLQTPSSAPQPARRFIDGGEFLEYFAPSPTARRSRSSRAAAPSRCRSGKRPSPHLGAEPFARRRLGNGCTTQTLAFVGDSGPASSVSRSRRSAKPASRREQRADIGRVVELAASPADDAPRVANHRHELLAVSSGARRASIDTSPHSHIGDLAFSPDGRWLAYVRWPARETSIIRIAKVKSGAVHDVTTLCASTVRPRGIPKANICTSSRRAISTPSTTRSNSI